jgi:hypothetical protein
MTTSKTYYGKIKVTAIFMMVIFQVGFQCGIPLQIKVEGEIAANLEPGGYNTQFYILGTQRQDNFQSC